MSEWQAYERVYGPLGSYREDYHNARLLWLISCIMAKEGARPEFDDFMPQWDSPGRPNLPDLDYGYDEDDEEPTVEESPTPERAKHQSVVQVEAMFAALQAKQDYQ